jgi:hypothetical protein
MINRGQTSQEQPLNIVGSSVFGRYPKISIEKTYNMFMSDNWMVPYAGYQLAIPASALNSSLQGRALHTSIKLNRLIGVFGNSVYLININFNQKQQKTVSYQAIKIGELLTSSGVVYIAENNKPQVLISDNTTLYVYDPAGPTSTPPYPAFSIATQDGTKPISFIPGFIDFHDTYFMCAASADGFYNPDANNTWRLSAQSNGLLWPDATANIGLLQTKPDNTQAVVRFPSKGNMIFVFGKTVAEPWFDVGYQLFPYQRSSSFNGDYGCLNPTTIAATDELVVWLGINEKGGPVLMYSSGGKPEQITTDGFDYVLSNMTNPSDSEGFIYRQDGHLFYHINFYTDNLSFFVDFLKDGTFKIYHACDENGNYFIAGEVAFFNNQYYFISKNNGNLYAFDTIFTTFDGKEIPRKRMCKNIRNHKQEYFIANDCGFTIESGNTDYVTQNLGPIYLTTQDKYANPFYLVTQNCQQLITQDGKKLIAQQADLCDTYCAPPKKLISQGSAILFITQDGKYLVTQDNQNLIAQQPDPADFSYLIANQSDIQHTVPRIDLAISIDGGEHFSSFDSQYLPPIGQRKNKLMWWQLGVANDLVCEFNFVGLGRFVCTDGVVNIRQ